MRGLPVEAARGAAERAGLRAGDEIVAVDGRPAVDVLDLEAAAADDSFALTVRRDGRELALNVDLERGESHGVALAGGLGAPVRRCRNDCRFCFIDQVPAGLRPSLRVKDDDYRLSFLRGTFITLTNMDEDDLARVERLRLSPLFVSLHDWDDERRARLMGEPARASRAKLVRLARAGIELHVQVVLCPGWNDGVALAETIAGLAAVSAVADVGVVPVSLTAEGELRRVTADDAARAIALDRGRAGPGEVEPREGLRARRRRALPAGRPPAAGERRRAAVRERRRSRRGDARGGRRGAARRGAGRLALAADGRRFALLTGILARPVIEEVCDRSRRGGSPRGRATAPRVPTRLAARRPRDGARVRPYVVGNELFGPHVTVTGLLGGRDVLRSLREQPLAAGEWLLAPEAFLPSELGVTLDDVPFETLREACDGRFAVGRSLAEAFAGAGR